MSAKYFFTTRRSTGKAIAAKIAVSAKSFSQTSSTVL